MRLPGGKARRQTALYWESRPFGSALKPQRWSDYTGGVLESEGLDTLEP